MYTAQYSMTLIHAIQILMILYIHAVKQANRMQQCNALLQSEYYIKPHK